MSTTYRTAGAGSFGFDRTGLPVVEAVAAVARRLWPNKTARHLAARAGTTHRAAENWLSLTTGMSGDALAELLRSDAGLAVLEGIMGEARPTWWPAFRTASRIDATEARLTALAAELAEVKRDLA